jgi:hypothetical protein
VAQKEGEKERGREQKKKVKQEKRKGETGEGYSEAVKRKEKKQGLTQAATPLTLVK